MRRRLFVFGLRLHILDFLWIGGEDGSQSSGKPGMLAIGLVPRVHLTSVYHAVLPLSVTSQGSKPDPIGVTEAPDTQKQNLDWYIANQKELASKYDGKILLIVNRKLIGVFNDFGEALEAASAKYAPGTFTLQPCSAEPTSYTMVLYSPVYGAMG